MKISSALMSALIMVLSLSACGRKSTRQAAASNGQKTQTAGEQASFQDKAVKEMATEAKCQSDIPVDQAPEGFKEVKLSELKGVKSSAFVLVHVRMNGVVHAADGHIVSGSTSSAIELDEQMKSKSIATSIDCKELMGGDKFELVSSPVLAMDATSGEFAERLGVRVLLEPSGDSKKEQIYVDSKATGTFFDELKAYEKNRQAMQGQGEDVVIKAYKDKDGNLEIRKAQLKRSKLFSDRMLLSTAFSYRAVLIQDGAQK